MTSMAATTATAEATAATALAHAHATPQPSALHEGDQCHTQMCDSPFRYCEIHIGCSMVSASGSVVTNANVVLGQLPLQFLNFFTQRHSNVTPRVRDSGQPESVMEHTIGS